VLDKPLARLRTIFEFRPPCSASSLILPVVIVVLSTNSADAIEIGFEHVGWSDDTLTAELGITDSLTARLTEYINKGVPAAFEYRIELWRSRDRWFDRQTTSLDISYKVRYDMWTKKYTVLKIDPDFVVEYVLSKQRAVFELVFSTDRIGIPIDDTSGSYYLVGKLSVKIMTLSNFREVESWLKGEISHVEKNDIKKAPDKFGEFLFNTALSVTGLKNVSLETRTVMFRLRDLPLMSGDKNH
jgi:hypothetical protein